jgi:hypothetical protein
MERYKAHEGGKHMSGKNQPQGEAHKIASPEKGWNAPNKEAFAQHSKQKTHKK